MHTDPNFSKPVSRPSTDFSNVPVPTLIPIRQMPELARSGMFADLAGRIGPRSIPILIPSPEDQQAAAKGMADTAESVGDFFSADGQGGRVLAREGDLRLIEDRSGAKRVEARQLGEWTEIAPVIRSEDGKDRVDATRFDTDGAKAVEIPLDWPLITERTDKNFPLFNTHSDRARKEARHEIEGLQKWQAHHLIPFNVATTLPLEIRLKIESSKWKMDSIENIVALPADMGTYMSPPNDGALPFHSSAHPRYDQIVEALLIAALSDPKVVSPLQVREAILSVEAAALLVLMEDRAMHPRVR